MAAINTPVQWEVMLLGQDISEDVESIGTLTNTLDVPRLTEYIVSDVSMRLMPNRYDYAPDKSSNFFTDNGHDASGYKAALVVKGGFRGEALQTLFSGRVIELTHEVVGQGFNLVATDRSIDLRDETITDFGIPKNNNLDPAGEQVGIRGRYNFAEPVTPVSEGSVSGTLGSHALTEVQNFDQEGMLSETEFQLGAGFTSIETEIADSASPTRILNTTYKAPFRGVSIDRIIRELLSAYSIPSTTAVLPEPIVTDPHWSYFSRPSYEIESPAPGPNNHLFGWNGYVTDFVRQGNGDMFFLYSHRGSEFRPKLIKYVASTDTWETITTAATHAEWWQLATTDFDEFFIIQTTGTWSTGLPTFGTYNAAEAGRATSIVKYTISTRQTNTYVNSGNIRPQLAVHYWSGFIKGTGHPLRNNARFGFLPDTRTGFHVAENAVWYRYANATQFGLARIRTATGSGEAVITNTIDEFANEASFDFTLDVSSRTIYASHTSIGESAGTLRTRHLVYTRSMPTSY